MDKEYGMYIHDSKPTKAVNMAFNWPGFWFSGVWAAANGMWIVCILLMSAEITVIKIIDLLFMYDYIHGAWSLLIILCLFRYYVGLYYFNLWIEIFLERNGYTFSVSMPATSIKEAVILHSAWLDETN